jgi:hypothetical protein
LGTDVAIPLSEYADVPVIDFADALGGYFASRILGAKILKRGGILERYMEAINNAYSERILYASPDVSDPADDLDPRPIQGAPSAPGHDSEEPT